MSDTGKMKNRLSFFGKKTLFDELAKILNASQLHTMVIFSYLNDEDLVKTQKNLIELGSHCLVFSEYVDFEEREQYYYIL